MRAVGTLPNIWINHAGDNRPQVRRWAGITIGCSQPLRGTPVGRAEHSDLAIAPGLPGYPLNGVVTIHIVGEEPGITGDAVRIQSLAHAL